MKHVVVLSAFLSPMRSGAEACAEEVPLALIDRYNFTIVTARMRRSLPKRDILQNKIPIIRVGIGIPMIDKWLYPFLAPLVVLKLKPDVVHAVLETFAGLALVFCRAPHKILTCQTTNRHFLRKFILKSAHTVTVISKALLDLCATHGRTDAILIPNGVRLDLIHWALESTKREEGTVLFVGRLEPMKGVEDLLTAFRDVEKEATLHIVGEGSLRHALDKRARILGIADRVKFLGYLRAEDLAKEYARAQVFVGLSKSEALGNVFLEAQAAGCAVIGTNVGGIPDIISHEHTGLLVPSGDPKAATEAINTLLSDATLRDRLSSTAQLFAEKMDWSVIAESYARLYER